MWVISYFFLYLFRIDTVKNLFVQIIMFLLYSCRSCKFVTGFFIYKKCFNIVLFKMHFPSFGCLTLCITIYLHSIFNWIGQCLEYSICAHNKLNNKMGMHCLSVLNNWFNYLQTFLWRKTNSTNNWLRNHMEITCGFVHSDYTFMFMNLIIKLWLGV